MTHKRNRRESQRNTPEALAAGIPAELRSFDRWLYNSGDRVGLPDYFVALGRHIANRHGQVIWECVWRSRCEWIGWRTVMADGVFQAAAAVMIWFQTAKRLVISVRHSGALIR